MLQTLREKTSGWIASVVLGLLIIPFAFFGVNNYFSTQAETWVAKIGDVEIDQSDFRARFEEYRAQMRNSLGDAFDGRAVDTPESKRRVLDGMIEEELLRQTGARLGMTVSDAQLQREIAAIPAFQTDGKFDSQQYLLLLASQRMTPASFQQRVRSDLETRALAAAVAGSALATTADIERYLRLRDQTRDLRVLELPAPAADAVAEPTAEELAKYFDGHAGNYVSDETVALDYIELDSSKIEVPSAADDETLEQRYEEQKARFTETAQRLASHILIRAAQDAPAEQQQAAQAKAQSLAEQARAEGADFAALAKENSEDPGSKNAGGDLGWIEAGFTDPAFETALFAMQAGEISAPVKSAEGWHVIQLREVREGKVKPFEEVRAELEREFLETERERRQSEMAGRLVDIIYRDPSTLATAASELDLPIKHLDAFSRSGGADPLSMHPEVLKAAFSDASIKEQNASDPIDLGDGRTVVIKVAEHQASRPMKLDEVKDQVVSDYLRDRRSELAKQHGEALLARLAGGETLDAVASAEKLQVKSETGVGRNGSTLDRAIIDRAFEMPRPSDKQPSRDLVNLLGERYALVELVQVSDGDPSKVDAEQRKALRAQMAQAVGSAETRALISMLRENAEIKVSEERL